LVFKFVVFVLRGKVKCIFMITTQSVGPMKFKV